MDHEQKLFEDRRREDNLRQVALARALDHHADNEVRDAQAVVATAKTFETFLRGE